MPRLISTTRRVSQIKKCQKMISLHLEGTTYSVVRHYYVPCLRHLVGHGDGICTSLGAPQAIEIRGRHYDVSLPPG